MKVFFEKVFEMSDGYQEIFIDETFTLVDYKEIKPREFHLHGIRHDDVFVLEPLGYYKFKLKSIISNDVKAFRPSKNLLVAGLILSDVGSGDKYLYIYNTTKNHVLLKSDTIMGEAIYD